MQFEVMRQFRHPPSDFSLIEKIYLKNAYTNFCKQCQQTDVSKLMLKNVLYKRKSTLKYLQLILNEKKYSYLHIGDPTADPVFKSCRDQVMTTDSKQLVRRGVIPSPSSNFIWDSTLGCGPFSCPTQATYPALKRKQNKRFSTGGSEDQCDYWPITNTEIDPVDH